MVVTIVLQIPQATVNCRFSRLHALNEPLVVTTGSFGYFSVDGLTAGETYVVTVNSQRYTFSVPSRVYNLVDNITDADFVAD